MNSMVLGSGDPNQILLQDGIISSGFATDAQFGQGFCDYSTSTLNTSSSAPAMQSTSQENSPNKLPVDMNTFDMTFMSPQKTAISLMDKSLLSPKSLFSPSTPLKLKSPPSILRKRKRGVELFGEGTPSKRLLQSPPPLFGSPVTPSKFLLSPTPSDKLFSPFGSNSSTENKDGFPKPLKSQVIKKLNFADSLLKENIKPGTKDSQPAPLKTTPGKVKCKKKI